MADGLYLYGMLAHGDCDVSIQGFGPVRLIDRGWCAAIASDVALADWRGPAMEDAAELECRARVHFSVLQAVLECGTPVPMRFGTVVKTADLDAFLSAGRMSIEAGLALANNGREWVVHLSPAPEEAKALALEADPEFRSLEQRISESAPGAAYLLSKKRDSRVAEFAERMAARVRASLAPELAPFAVASAALPSRPHELERIAWLVPSECETAFIAAARRTASQSGVSVRLVGPSPPYSFVPAGAEGVGGGD